MSWRGSIDLNYAGVPGSRGGLRDQGWHSHGEDHGGGYQEDGDSIKRLHPFVSFKGAPWRQTFTATGKSES